MDMGEAGGAGWSLGIEVGQGRNDGLNRIYMTRINGHVYEYFYEDPSWTITDLGDPNATLYGVTVGAGRNDDTNRVYACGDGVPTVEYSWTGATWGKDIVEGGAQQQWLPEVGDGRGDGTNRLYFPNGMGPLYTVAEYTWTGLSYDRNDLPSVAGNPLSVSIGKGRNDGVVRVYASSRSKAYEFTYDGGGWQTVDILPSRGEEERYDICLGTTKQDGKLRAYITCSGSEMLEASWDGGTWVDTAVDAVSSATCGVAIGAGRNDDTVRVYGCNRGGEVHEFTHSNPYVHGSTLFIRADANGDTAVSMSDAIYTLRYLYLPGGAPPPCLKTADTNDDGDMAMSDALHTMRYLYVPGAPTPADPFPECGSDPTPDGLGCIDHPCMGRKMPVENPWR
jgi:hypothetical protein